MAPHLKEDIDDQPILVRSIVNEMESVKRALVDLHRQILLLFNFFMISQSVLLRLLKRFNKILPGAQWDTEEVFPEKWNGQKLRALKERVDGVYATWFCDGDVREAQAQMLAKKDDDLDTDWTQLRLGGRLGFCVALVVWICADCLWYNASQGTVTVGGRSAFPVFRAAGGLLLWHWCWGVSVTVWRRYRINYIYLFDFQPKTVLAPIAIFNDCVDESLVFLVTLLLYYKVSCVFSLRQTENFLRPNCVHVLASFHDQSSTHTMPEVFGPGFYPALLVLYMVFKCIFPLKQRRPLWAAIIKGKCHSVHPCTVLSKEGYPGNYHHHLFFVATVWTSPLSSPTFFHTYVADVFTR